MSLTNYLLKDSCSIHRGKTRPKQGYLVKVLRQSSDASSTCVDTSHLLLHTAEAIDLLFQLLGFGGEFIQALRLCKSNQLRLRMESKILHLYMFSLSPAATLVQICFSNKNRLARNCANKFPWRSWQEQNQRMTSQASLAACTEVVWLSKLPKLQVLSDGPSSGLWPYQPCYFSDRLRPQHTQTTHPCKQQPLAGPDAR